MSKSNQVGIVFNHFQDQSKCTGKGVLDLFDELSPLGGQLGQLGSLLNTRWGYFAMGLNLFTHSAFQPEAEPVAPFISLPTESHPLIDRRLPRIAVKANGRILFLSLGDVVAVLAEGNYVSLQRHSGSVLLRESISVLAKKLELYGFVRIHRSALVNSSFVEEIRPYSTGEYVLRVKGGKEYTVTRKYKNNLNALAEFWIGGSALSRRRRR